MLLCERIRIHYRLWLLHHHIHDLLCLLHFLPYLYKQHLCIHASDLHHHYSMLHMCVYVPEPVVLLCERIRIHYRLCLLHHHIHDLLCLLRFLPYLYKKHLCIHASDLHHHCSMLHMYVYVLMHRSYKLLQSLYLHRML